MQVAQQQRTVLTNLLPEDQSEFELPMNGRAKQIIQDILIAKQYSNPLKAACREALQNTLDANKEAGNQSLPITIILPTEEEPLLIFKDCGVGIGAERFENVYKKWGESTKRVDNSQMGGFGVGRFSALAVASQVTITSVCDGIKYHHVLYYNNRGCPAAGTLDTYPTDEPNGTELSIPIKENDLYKVHDYLRELTMWVQQPIVFKQGYSWQFQKTDDWKLTGVTEKEDVSPPWYFRKENTTKLQVTVLVGQLPYILHHSFLQGILTKFDTSDKITSSNVSISSSLVVRLPVGSVELTSNREEISNTEDNIEKLQDLVSCAIKDVELTLEKKLQLESFRESLKAFYRDYPFDSFSFLVNGRQRTVTKDHNLQYANRLTTNLFESCSMLWGSFKDSVQTAVTKEVGDRHFSKGENPTIFRQGHKLEPFLDCVWVVYPKGMSKNRIRKLANVPYSKHILAIKTDYEPEDYVKRHSLLSIMDDLITVNFEKKSTKPSESKKAALKSLVKSGGARTLIFPNSSVSNIYESTTPVDALLESGVYIRTEEAKSKFQYCHIPPSLDSKDLFFVTNSIAERLDEDTNWVKFKDYCTAEFDELTAHYQQGLELIDYTIDQKWFSSNFLFGKDSGSFALADILSASSIEGDDVSNLIELLTSPRKANWLATISGSQFLEIIDLDDSTQGEREKKRVRLQNLSWVLRGKTVESGDKANYFPGYQWTNIPIFNKLVKKYPLLTYLLRYYDFNMPWSNYTLPPQQLDLVPQIIKYMKDCDL